MSESNTSELLRHRCFVHSKQRRESLVASVIRLRSAISFRRKGGARAVFASLMLVITACGNDDSSAGSKNDGVTLRFSGVATDTIEAQIPTTITAEVRAANGKLLPNIVVHFGGLPAGVYPGRYDEAAAYVCVVSSTLCTRNIASAAAVTDEHGRAEIRVRLGNIVGKMLVVAATDVLVGSDTVAFTVVPGAPARIKAFSADVLLDVGKSTMVSGTVADRFGNLRPEQPLYSLAPGSAGSIDSVTGVVRGLDVGSQTIFARRGSAVDSTMIGVRPPGRLIGATNELDVGIHELSFDAVDDRTVLPPDVSVVNYVRSASREHNRIPVVVNSDGQRAVRIIDSLGATVSTIQKSGGFGDVLTVRSMADGSAMLIARPRDPYPSPNYMTVYRASREGVLTQLSDLPTLAPDFLTADIAPDGTRVAFIARTPAQTNELRVLTLATGNTVVLAPDTREPRFSPTSDRIAYLVTGKAPPAGLAVVAADGSGARTVNAAEFAGGVSWSPDGTMLIARLAASRRLRIVRVADGAFVTLRFLDRFGLDRNLVGIDWW